MNIDCVTSSDSKGLKRAAPLQTAHTDPAIDEFEDTVDDLIQFCYEDSLNAAESIPGGHGMHGPDIERCNRWRNRVIELAKRLHEPRTVAAPAIDNGLLTIHDPDRRLL